MMTFGNADYFGMYCAMLLPLMTALIAREGTTKRLVAQLIAAVLLAAALLLSHVMNAILIGFGLTLIFLGLGIPHQLETCCQRRHLRCSGGGCRDRRIRLFVEQERRYLF